MRILTFTLLILLFVNCSKDDKETTAESTSPLVTTWQMDDLDIDGEIGGTKISIDLDGLVDQMASGDDTTPKEQIKACIKSIKMEFKKDTFKLYPSITNSTCEQLKETSGNYTADGKKITFEKAIDFILEGIPVKEINYTIANDVLTLTIDSEYNGIEANFKVTFNKE